MRILYFLLCFCGSVIWLNAQVIEEAPTHNSVLLKYNQLKLKEKVSILHRFSRTGSSLSRGAGCNNDVLPPITLLVGNTQQICIDTSCLDGSFEGISISCEPSAGTLMAINNTVCYDYTANQAGKDTLCFEVCDADNNCHTLLYLVIVNEALALPFFDDFARGGPHPNPKKWIDNDVFINNTFAFEPPSVGVATFDGLDPTGSPHGGGFGNADFLTSNFINLDGFHSTNNVFLSFWLQRKGLGDKPEAGDAMQLEFLNDQNQWESIAMFPGFSSNVSSDTLEPFQFYAYQIAEDKFLHRAFQFRFNNLNPRTGAVDLWHLDYVKLEANASNTAVFQDIAFTQAPNSFLKNYTAIPRNHLEGFEDQELNEVVTASFRSHYGTQEAITSNNAALKELVTNVSFPGFPILNGQEANFGPGERKTVSKENPNFAAYLSATQNNFSNTDSLVFQSTFTLSKSGQSPLVFANDTVRNETILYNYFAYDDGTSESNIIAQNLGTEIAIRFQANVPDTLRAIQIHFPHINEDVSTQLFNLKVYTGQLDQTPEYEAVFQRPFYTDSILDTLQGFTSYVLLDDFGEFPQPLFLPQGDFYISWQQASTTNIPVGFDKNNTLGTNQAFSSTDNGISWQSFPDKLKGSPMVRPVVGNVTPVHTPTNTEEPPLLSEWMEIYPNPARDHLVFRVKNGNYADYELQLFNNMGQLLRQETATAQWLLNEWNSGVYFLKIYNNKTQQSLAHKLVILK